MRVNIFKRPDPLTIGKGEESFQLLVRKFSDRDRMAIVNAVVAQDFVKILDAVAGLIVGWGGVVSDEGSPIPFESMDDSGKPQKNLAAFLAAIPLLLQFEIILGMVALVGLKAQAEFLG